MAYYISDGIFEHLRGNDRRNWLRFEKMQRDLFELYSDVQANVLKLEREMEQALKYSAIEIMSVPAKGVAGVISNTGIFVDYLAQGLLLTTDFTRDIANALKSLAEANLQRSHATNFLANNLSSLCNKTGDALIYIGNGIKRTAPKLPTPLDGLAYLFVVCFKGLGLAIKALTAAIKIAAKLDSSCIAPAIEKICCGLVRVTGVLVSIAEAIRETTKSLNHMCDYLAKKINFKPDSQANTMLANTSKKVAKAAMNFIFRPFSSHKATSITNTSTRQINNNPRMKN